MNPVKRVHVAAAIIHSVNDEGREVILATERSYGDYLGFEFPGGKLEEGETPEEAVVRELLEEMDTRVEVDALIKTVEHDYPLFHLTMECFWCHVKEGELTLKEHKSARWLTKEELDSVSWLPADTSVIEILKETMN